VYSSDALDPTLKKEKAHRSDDENDEDESSEEIEGFERNMNRAPRNLYPSDDDDSDDDEEENSS
jgi:hypothetical protein